MLVQPASTSRPSAGRRRTSADEYLFYNGEPPPPYQLRERPSLVGAAGHMRTDPHPRGPRRPLPPRPSSGPSDHPSRSPERVSVLHSEHHAAQRPFVRLLSVITKALRPAEPTARPNKLHKAHSTEPDLRHQAAVDEVYTPVTRHPFREPSVSHPPLTNASRTYRNLCRLNQSDSDSQEQQVHQAFPVPPPLLSTENLHYCHKCQYRFYNSKLLDLHLLLIHGPPSYNHPLCRGRSYYT